MVTAGQAAGGAGKDGRVVALPPFRQTGPPAEGIHHMMVGSHSASSCLALRGSCRARPFHDRAGGASRKPQLILVPTMDLTHHLA